MRRVASARITEPRPPGPPGIWFFGNAYQIPSDRQWLQFDDWTRTYGKFCSMSLQVDRLTISKGDIVQLTVTGQPILILGSMRAAHDLLHSRGTNHRRRCLQHADCLSLTPLCRHHIFRQAFSDHGRRAVCFQQCKVYWRTLTTTVFGPQCRMGPRLGILSWSKGFSFQGVSTSVPQIHRTTACARSYVACYTGRIFGKATSAPAQRAGRLSNPHSPVSRIPFTDGSL